MCAEVHPFFFSNCEELSDLFLAPEAGRCFEGAISIRGFGLLCDSGTSVPAHRVNGKMLSPTAKPG